MEQIVLVALVLLGTFAVLLLIGVPIALSIAIASVTSTLCVLPLDTAVLTASQRMFSGINSFSLLAIPFFVLAGNIMNSGGIAHRLVRFANLLSGRLPGSLAHTNVVGNMLFGSLSGSGTAAAVAIGGVMIPMEQQEGYDQEFSAAVNIASAPTGLLIPPSGALIVYALVSGGTSVAALFMGGILPGILWGLGVIAVAFVIAKKRGYTVSQNSLKGNVVKILLEAIPALLLIVIVMGGILMGVFTATEAAGIAVAYSLFLSMVVYREIKFKDLPNILFESVKMTSIIIFLISASSIMSWIMAFTNIPNTLSAALLSITDNPIVLLLMMNLLLMIVGTFMDMTPAILIFTPILLPIVTNFGMNPIHFGIMMVFNLSLGLITPPVGAILFVGTKVANTRLEAVIKELIPFIGVIVLVLLLVTFIPQISLFLPQLTGSM